MEKIVVKKVLQKDKQYNNEGDLDDKFERLREIYTKQHRNLLDAYEKIERRL